MKAYSNGGLYELIYVCTLQASVTAGEYHHREPVLAGFTLSTWRTSSVIGRRDRLKNTLRIPFTTCFVSSSRFGELPTGSAFASHRRPQAMSRVTCRVTTLAVHVTQGLASKLLSKLGKLCILQPSVERRLDVYGEFSPQL